METTKAKSQQMTNEHELALNELFIEELQDIYWAEKHLINVLPKMAKKVTLTELRNAIENHVKETENHVKRLEHVFDSIDTRTAERKSEGMAGLIKDGEDMMNQTGSRDHTRDAGIISAFQKIEHYEIACYGTLKTMADVLGHHEAANLLEATLNEERSANNLLSQIAQRGINQLVKN